MRRFGSPGGKPKAAGRFQEGALQQGRNYGLKNRDCPRPAARQPKLPRPWHDAVPSGAVPDIKPAVGGNQGSAVAVFSSRERNKTMLVLKRLIAFVVTSVTLFAGGVAFAGLGKPDPWEFGLQQSASPVMDDIVWFHDFLNWLIVAIALFVLALLLIVIVRFNARRNPVPSRTTHNTMIEVLWTVVPVIILVTIAVPSFRLLFYELKVPPADLTVKVPGKQWFWTYSYPDSKIEFDSLMVPEKDIKPDQLRLLSVDNEMVVPVNKVVHVLVTGADVIHSFSVPSFGIKIDGIPGRLNETWFKAEREGMYYGQCSQLCGRDHAFMPIAVHVVSEKEYSAWLDMAKKKFAADDDARPCLL